VASEQGFYDCFARVERATATDTVDFVRPAKRAGIPPHRKFVYDMRAKKNS